MNSTISAPPPPKSPLLKILLWILLAILILAVIGLAIWYFLWGPGRSGINIFEKIRTTSEVAKWTTFTSQTYGFSIKFPPEWEYNSQGTETTFAPKGATGSALLKISVKNENPGQTIEAQKKQFSSDYTFKEETETTLAGEKAIKLSFTKKTDQNIAPNVYLIEKNNRIYILSGEGLAGIYNEIVKKMIGTFKFVTTNISEEEIAFDVLSAGSISSETAIEEKNYVFKTNEEFKEVWEKVYDFAEQPKSLPQVDFAESMVIAVIAKQTTNTGFEIEISKIIETQTNLDVIIKETTASSGCIVTQQMNQPFEFIKIEKTDKEIKFTPQEEVKKCE